MSDKFCQSAFVGQAHSRFFGDDIQTCFVFFSTCDLYFCGHAAWAQRSVWGQVEAQRTLTGAQNAARGYASAGVNNIIGFALPGGWYGIAVGPFVPVDADRELRRLRGAGLIPSDSYVVHGGRFRTQFWPVGVTAPTDPIVVETPSVDPPVAAVDPVVVPEPDPVQIPDETVREAQVSEQALDRDEKRLLQIALQ